jgi:hypothetical protein
MVTRLTVQKGLAMIVLEEVNGPKIAAMTIRT